MKTTLSWLCRLTVGAVLFWLGAVTAAAAVPYQEEEAIDREVGLISHRWKINLVNLRSSDYLRLHSQVKTGLQSFDQQVERANESPPELMVILKPPVVSPVSDGKGGGEEPVTSPPPHPPGWEPPPVVIIIKKP